ncbi:MAG: hypothetical protein AAGD14_14360 [Planctomycetota bacterium]
MAEEIVFLPLPARRALRSLQQAFPQHRLEIFRRGPIRTPVRAVLHTDDGPVSMTVLSPRELSAELRRRQDRSLDPLAALRVPGAWAARVAAATEGSRPVDPVHRGLALTALVARAQLEDESWEGRAEEPARLLAWLERHDAEGALTEVERGWLLAPVDAMPEEALEAGFFEELTQLAVLLRVAPDLVSFDVPGLLNAFGILQDELPEPLRR